MSRLDGDDMEMEDLKGIRKGEGGQSFTGYQPGDSGDEVSRVLIYLPSFTFRRHEPRLGDSSITMTVMSATECVPLLKCSVTGETSVLQCVMSDRLPLILAWSG